MKFNEKLTKLRKENNLNQEQLADKLDVSRQAVSKWESGQTYPEMDKLIALSKIFKCSLDDLTNDDIDIKDISKEKNTVDTFINEICLVINKSFKMFKSMSVKQIAKCIFEMFLVFLIILLFRIPIVILYNLGYNIFSNFGSYIGPIFSSIWKFMLEVIYLAVGFIIFFYVYKIRFLDNFEEDSVIEKENIRKENNQKVDETKIKDISHFKDNDNTILKFLGACAIIFMKFVVLCIGVPFLISFMFLFIGLILELYLFMNGVVYFGILVLIISGIIINLFILEVIFNILFNRSYNKKRLFIMLITSIAGIGIGFGIFATEISTTKYIDSVPEQYIEKIDSFEFDMLDNLYIRDANFYHYDQIEYITSDIENIKIEVSYYDSFNDMHVYLDNFEDNSQIMIFTSDKNGIQNEIINLFLNDLKLKSVHNYGLLYSYKIKVYANEYNINRLKDNYNNALKIEKENMKNDEENYYIEQIDNYTSRIDELEENNQKLIEQNEEYKSKIENYKETLNSMLED